MKAIIWTDASCKDGEGFIAVVVLVNDEVVSEWTERIATCNNYHAEFFAIFRATQLALILGIDTLEIHCDHLGSVARSRPGKCKKPLKTEHLVAVQSSLFTLIPCFAAYKVRLMPRQDNLAHKVARRAMRQAGKGMGPVVASPIAPGEMQLQMCVDLP